MSENEVRGSSNFWMIIYIIYQIRVAISSCVFFIQYVRDEDHSIFQIIFLGSIISFFKALIWPIIIFF